MDRRDRPTDRPPRRGDPASPRVDTDRAHEAFRAVLDALRVGVRSAVDLFLDTQGDVLRRAMLRMAMDYYQEGAAQGQRKYAAMTLSYLVILDEKHQALTGETLYVRPEVTAQEVRDRLAAKGMKYALQEIEKFFSEHGIR